MNFAVIFLLLLALGAVSLLALVVLRSPEKGAALVALSLIRTSLLATSALLVVITVRVVAENANPDDTGQAGGSFILALVVAAISFACERDAAAAEAAGRAASVEDGP